MIATKNHRASADRRAGLREGVEDRLDEVVEVLPLHEDLAWKYETSRTYDGFPQQFAKLQRILLIGCLATGTLQELEAFPASGGKAVAGLRLLPKAGGPRLLPVDGLRRHLRSQLPRETVAGRAFVRDRSS